MQYITLDVARAIAAVSVFLTHWGLWTREYQDPITINLVDILCYPIEFIWTGGGTHPGVIIFIVLSGFCIHLPLAIKPDLYKLKNYWIIYFKRRVVRIFPVYWLGLILGITCLLIVDSDFRLSENPLWLFLSFVMSSVGLGEIVRYTNVFPYLYWGNGPLNTVAVEIILYATYPLLYIVYLKRKYLYLIGFCGSSYLIIVCLRYFEVDINVKATYFEFLPYWAWGALCATFSVRQSKQTFPIAILIAIILIMSFTYLYLINYIHIKGLHVITTNLFAIIVGLLLLVLTCHETTSRKHDTKYLKPFSIISRRGYSLYAMHTPTIFLTIWALQKTSLATWTFPWFILFITILTTEICYRFIERPTQKLSKRLGIT